MRTRSVTSFIALLSLTAVLALSACKLMTGASTGVELAPGGSQGGVDTTGNGAPPPPPPPSGLSFGVSDDSMATAGRTGNLQLFAGNHDAAPDTVKYKVLGPEGWTGLPATGSLVVPGNASATANVPVAVPAGTASGLYPLQYFFDRTDGTTLQSGTFSLFVHPS